MQTEFINSIVNTDYSGATQPKFEDGRFSLLNRSMALADVAGFKGQTNLESMTNFQICGFKPILVVDMPVSDHTGYNKKFIDDDGIYNPMLAIDEFSKRVPGIRLSKLELEALGKSGIQTDSHEMFLYNMLVSWYKAVLYTDTKGTDGTFRITQSAYKDSHVGIGIRGQYTEVTHEIDLGPPVADFDPNKDIFPRIQMNYWDKPFVMRISNKSGKQVAFYIAHSYGRDGFTALNVDIPLPSMDHSQTMWEGTSGPLPTIAEFSEIPWDRPETLWTWIKDYVTVNRVQSAFAAAFETLSAIYAQPMPSYQESALWHKAELKIHLANYSPTRGRNPANMEGEPFISSTDPHQFLIDETQSPRTYLLSAAIVNYMMWMGAGVVIDEYSRDLSDWRAAYVSSDSYLEVLTGIESRAALASTIVGKEIVTCMNHNAYFDIDLSPMAEVSAVRADEVFDPDYPATLPITGPVPYVSGALVFGAVACEAVSIDHLRSMINVTVDEYGTTSPEDAVKVAQCYRTFGHQATMAHDKSGELYTTYANVRECIIFPGTILDNTRSFDHVKMVSSAPRAGRNDALPNLQMLSRGGKLSMTVSRPSISVCRWNQKARKVLPTAVLRQRATVLEFKVKGSRVFAKAVMRAKPNSIPVSGFHSEEVGMAPLRPGLTGTPVSTTKPPGDEADDTAETVE